MSRPMIDGTVKPGGEPQPRFYPGDPNDPSDPPSPPKPAAGGNFYYDENNKLIKGADGLPIPRPAINFPDPNTPNVLTQSTTIYLYDPRVEAKYPFVYGDLVAWGWMPAGLTVYNYLDHVSNAEVALLDFLGEPSGGGGARGAGGAVGPVYIKPDERLIEDAVKATLAALAGKVDPTFLDSLVSLYMSEHKRSFDVQETEQLDPMESVKAKIRESADYKTIHGLRPESVDEWDWISSRQGALKRAGVSDAVSEELGISQATVGSSLEDAAFAGNIATFASSGKDLALLKERKRKAIYGALQLI